jgi:hypothetical protein
LESDPEIENQDAEDVAEEIEAEMRASMSVMSTNPGTLHDHYSPVKVDATGFVSLDLTDSKERRSPRLENPEVHS